MASVLQLIDTALTFETVTFLRDLVMMAIVSPDYMAFLKRIMVVSLTIFKDPLPLRHEGIIAELIDTDHRDSDPMLIFLERTASPALHDQRSFSIHPGSNSVLQSIIHTLKEMPTLALLSLPTTTSTHDSPIPVYDFTHISSPPYHPIINTPESAHDPDDDPDDEPKRELSWFDAATLAATQALHAFTQLSATPYHANDRFVGSKNVGTYVPSLHNLRQIKLEPGTLPLIDLAILADCVHNHAMLYSMLEHHCYWFVQIICGIIKKLYPCTSIQSKQYAPVSKDNICMPTNDYLPDLEGRTMGILVCRVEEAVVSLMASEFETYKAAKLEEVHFLR